MKERKIQIANSQAAAAMTHIVEEETIVVQITAEGLAVAHHRYRTTHRERAEFSARLFFRNIDKFPVYWLVYDILWHKNDGITEGS